MFPLFETIRFLDGIFCMPDQHNERLNRSRSILFGSRDRWDLREMLEPPVFAATGCWKCRFSYGINPGPLTFEPYMPRVIRKLKAVYSDSIVYDFKYNDRSELNALLQQKEDADDILIVVNGKITDSSFTNLLFCKDDEWFTPAEPLLKGTMRQWLIDRSLVKETEIALTDLDGFDKIRLVNAMLPFEAQVDLPISAILR